MTNPNDRSILVTGASSGIGLASARLLKSRGWRVLATARRSEDLARLAEQDSVEALPLELSDLASVAACAREALERTEGRLYAIFNNAAYGQPGAVEDLTADVLRRQLEVNLIGTHELTRLVIPAMRAAGRGRIVQCSSVLGVMSAPYRGAYCASKFALEGLSDALRLELASSGIAVAIIQPGPIRTGFVARALQAFRANIDITGSPHRRTYEARLAAMERGGKEAFKLEPEAVAQSLLHAVESKRPRLHYRVTVPARAAPVLKRLLPARLLDRIAMRS
ncbi:MAG: SDR family NAD(P)-dependent oxidoreductase [Hyphomicrobiaceae bacterium]|nr:SDR family NAD(P)-dependent oxidoreductase [Hyphomicrobiaceae bacterium]